MLVQLYRQSSIDQVARAEAVTSRACDEIANRHRQRVVAPVGSRTEAVDVRTTAATHRDLLQLVDAGGFRADLCYRLHVIPIALPPLRERVSDIVPLARKRLRAARPGAPRRSRAGRPSTFPTSTSCGMPTV